MNNKSNHKRVLVTGGAGFLGSQLCERLLEMGNEVICVDNLFTGSKNNISHLFNNRNFESELSHTQKYSKFFITFCINLTVSFK